MLYITFKDDNSLRRVDAWFRHQRDPEWMNDPLVRAMVKDIDKNDVIDEDSMKSPVWGIQSVDKLSSGVKALILMYKTDKVIWASHCGDNCSKWIVEISKRKDITIVINHVLLFEQDFEAVCLDNGMHIRTLHDYRMCVLECL